MKTIQHYLEKMEEPERIQALRICRDKGSLDLKLDPDSGSVRSAIFIGFIWEETDQGDDYWLEIQRKYIEY